MFGTIINMTSDSPKLQDTTQEDDVYDALTCRVDFAVDGRSRIEHMLHRLTNLLSNLYSEVMKSYPNNTHLPIEYYGVSQEVVEDSLNVIESYLSIRGLLSAWECCGVDKFDGKASELMTLIVDQASPEQLVKIAPFLCRWDASVKK